MKLKKRKKSLTGRNVASVFWRLTLHNTQTQIRQNVCMYTVFEIR